MMVLLFTPRVLSGRPLLSAALFFVAAGFFFVLRKFPLLKRSPHRIQDLCHSSIYSPLGCVSASASHLSMCVYPYRLHLLLWVCPAFAVCTPAPVYGAPQIVTCAFVEPHFPPCINTLLRQEIPRKS
eukprot:RCo045414